MDKNTKLYQSFVKLYTSVHSSKSALACQIEANEVWKKRIKNEKNKIDMESYQVEVDELKARE